MAFKKNKVKVDLCSYPPYIIQGVPKVGKTTLVYDLAKQNYDGDLNKMLLVSFGKEDGFKALDDIQYEEIESWNINEEDYIDNLRKQMEDLIDNECESKNIKLSKKEFDNKVEQEINRFIEENGAMRGFHQLVDDLVIHNKEYGIKMIALDTFDEMVSVLIKEILRLHKIEMQGKECKSLNDAFGGFQRGRDRLIELMLDEITRLRKVGLAVFVISHTKVKEKTDPMTGETYDQLTNSLRSDIYNALATKAQMIVTISIERKIEDGKQVGETRWMNFRNDGTVDCGGRFVGLPDKLELSAENFMTAFRQGVKSSMNKKVSDEELDEIRQKELSKIDKKAKIFSAAETKEIEIKKEIDVDKNQKLIGEIQDIFMQSDNEVKEKVKQIMKENNMNKFIAEENKTSVLEEILEVLG